MAGILSKGLTLSYKTSSASTYTALTNLQEVPDIGGTTESVEVTTMGDAAHMFISGLISYGDALDFTFLYEPTQFQTLSALVGFVDWQVGIPDGAAGVIDTTCTFSGEASVKLNGVGTNAAMTYTLSIKPNSTLVWA